MTPRRRFRRTLAALAIPALALVACQTKDVAEARQTETSAGEVTRGWNPQAVAKVHAVDAAALRSAIATRLQRGAPTGFDADHWKHVQRVYKRYGDSPLWLNQDGLIGARVHALTNALVAAADSDALNVAEYPLADLTNAVRAAEQGTATPEQLADADVLLTTSYAALGEDLLSGQTDPKTLKQAWFIDPRDEALDSALARGLVTDALDSSLLAMRPQDQGYTGLRKALALYRGIAQRGGWGTVPTGKALKPGQSDSPARLAALRDRLRAEGYQVDATPAAPADSAPPPPPAAASGAAPRAAPARTPARPTATAGQGVYDRVLAGAVARFQANHNIIADSVLGDSTVVAMNTPVEYRVRQISANLERYRWMPRSFGTRYILVNVPAFRLEAHDSGRTVLDMKVVVGQNYQDKTTPAFADSMEMVVFRPYWLITPDIQAKETEPKIAADPGYMEANDLEYYTDGGKTRIRQKPGDKNSLGLVKFLFPNAFNIYLHDTPAKDLFDKDVRAFSHGCIRVEKPAELAQWVLGWDAAKVDEAMHSGPDNRTVKLPRKIPVYITYFTAYVDDGLVRFGNDLYDRDDRLVQQAVVGPNADATAAVAELRRVADGK